MELATLLGGLGSMGLLVIGWEGAGWLLSCSIAEIILTVQRGDLRGSLCLLMRASVLLGAGLDCYIGLWCVSGLDWGIPDQVKNILISFIRV